MSVRRRTWTDASGAEKSAWVVDYSDQAGKRRNKQFARKKDADAFQKRAGAEVLDGTHVADSDSITVAEAGKLWIAAKTRAGREASTIAQYQQHLDLHIAPFIGATRLTVLSSPALAAFEDELHDAGRSPAMIRKVRVSLGSLLADAQRRGRINRNVVREARGVSADRRAEKRAKGRLKVGVDIPAPEEIKALIGALSGRWRPLLLTAILTGLRASELRGLTWSAVDFEARTIHVHQRADRFNGIGKPKSLAGERHVPMTPTLVTTLKEWRLACPRRDTGRVDDDGKAIRELHYVFPNGDGKVESLANIRNRGLVPAWIRAGVTIPTGGLDKDGRPVLTARYPGMHALRHFHASWLINPPAQGGLGLSAKVVQERLGHSTIAMTLDVYSHLFPRGDDDAEMAAAERSLLA